jgi:hypothetical protein
MDTKNTPYSIKKPNGWDSIADYSRGGEKPTAKSAQQALDELLENIKLLNCEYFPDVVNAILRRLPGKVEAENYGHKGLLKSYSVNDTTLTSKFYRTSEHVPIELIDSNKESWISEQCIKLEKDEWTVYEMNVDKSQSYSAVIRFKAVNAPAKCKLTLNGQSKEIEIAEPGWIDKDIGALEFKHGINSVKIFVSSGTINFDWFMFE